MSLRNGSNTIVVWLILGVIVIVFGLSFGLPTESLTLGPQSLARVHGEDVRSEEWTYQYRLAKFRPGRIPSEPAYQKAMKIRELMLESIVERRVMAELAEDAGLAAVTRDAELMTAEGHLISFGYTFDWMGDEPFDFEIFNRFLLPRLRVSEKIYLDIQRREILARTLRDLIAANTVVAESEVRAAYDEREDRVALRYVAYDPKAFAELAEVSDEKIEAYVRDHGDELRTEFESQSIRFRNLPKQVDLSYLRVSHPADNEAMAKQVAETIEAARARLAQGTSFAAIARELSDESQTAGKGGNYGWVDLEAAASALDAMDLKKVVVDAAKSLSAGETSKLVRGSDASFLVHIRGVREGDVAEADALRELAREALSEAAGRALAQKTARAHLAALQSGTSFDDLFVADGENAPGRTIGGMKLGPGAAIQFSVESTGAFRKSAPVPGLGRSAELTRAAWAADPAEDVLGSVFEVAGQFVVADVETHDRGTDEGFAEIRDELRESLIRQRAEQTTASLARHHCVQGLGTGDIAPNPAAISGIIAYEGSAGATSTNAKYNLCEMAGARGGPIFALSRMQGLW